MRETVAISWLRYGISRQAGASLMRESSDYTSSFEPCETSMISTYSTYTRISGDLQRATKQIAADPTVARQTKSYLEQISKIRSVDDFLKNDAVFRYAMKAYGLEDMSYAKGFIRKILDGGITDSHSIANKLTDSRYRIFAAAFDFKGRGAEAVQQISATTGTTDKYLQQSLETQAGQSNEGVRLALYFQRKAPTITSAYGILADSALLKVFQTAFSIPADSSHQDIDKQAKDITARLPVKDLHDPVKLQRFLQRFAATYDAANFDSSSSSTISLIHDGSSSNVSSDLLMKIQTLHRGA